MGSEHYCLRWNNHQSNLLGVFSQLLQDEFLVDVTLACDGHSVRAHKVVLSACSTYFQSLFTNHPDRHPIVILKDMKYCELKTLLEFMYKGEVNVEYSQLGTLLKTAESLQVKGLAEMTGEDQHPVSTETTTCSTIPLQNQPPATPNTHSVVTPNPNVTATTAVTNNSSLDMTSRLEKREDTSHDHSPPQTKRLRLKGRDSGESSEEDDEDSSAVEDVGSLRSEATTVPSPQLNEPVPGPSGVGTQIQQAPLSLKKENDWNRPVDERSTGESSSDFRELPDQNLLEAEVQIIEGSFSSPIPKDNDAHSPSGHPLSVQSPPGIGHTMGPPMHFGFPFGNLAALSQYSMAEGKDNTLLALLQQEQINRFLMGQGMESRSNNAAALMEQAMGMGATSPTGNQTPRSTSPPNALKCQVCLAYFPTPALMEQHMELHAREKPYKCEQCGQCYKYQSAYFKHKEQNHMARLPGEKPFHCDLCGMQFKYLKSFKKHRLNHTLERLHPKDIVVKREPFLSVCENGSEEGDSDGTVSGSEQYQANGGATSTSTSSSTQEHGPNNPFEPHLYRGSNHILGPLGADCMGHEVLGPEVTSQGLEKGIDGRNPHDIQSAIAESSSLLAALTAAATQSSAPSLVSPAAGRPHSTFSSQTSTSGMGRPDRPASCMVLPTGANDSYLRPSQAMSPLLNLLTGGENFVNGFVCPFCHKAFRTKENLKLHVRKHTGERPFPCEFCGRAFGGKSDLTRHMRTHTGERPYHCFACGKNFARADYLSKHLTTHS